MKTNKKTHTVVHTAEGAVAANINAKQQLRRSVMSCLLWEDSFYEEGVSIAKRITDLVKKVDPEDVASLAIEAREDFKLRHVPLLLVRELARVHKGDSLVSDTLARVIQRPDEMGEFVSLYWKEGRQPLSMQVRKGIAKAMGKFNEYSLAKYNSSKSNIKLRDILRLVHPSPVGDEQTRLWKRILTDELATPDTWEVALSAGKDKKETWTRLIDENKLGGLAFLRNLRNMETAKVDKDIVRRGFDQINVSRVLPFRFLSAANAAPKFEVELEKVMLKSFEGREKLPGKTLFIVDVSGSMGGSLSHKSEMNRHDAAAALAIVAREMCEDPVIYATAGNDMTRIHKTSIVPARHGFALKDAIRTQANQLGGGGIFLKQVMDYVKNAEGEADRIIVITDEQDCDIKHKPSTAQPFGRYNYMLNVSVEKNGIGYGQWTHIDGFSEAVLDFILLSEKENEQEICQTN